MCNMTSQLDVNHLEESSFQEDSSGIMGLYHMSYCYLGALGFVVTVSTAIVSAVIYNSIRNDKPEGQCSNFSTLFMHIYT